MKKTWKLIASMLMIAVLAVTMCAPAMADMAAAEPSANDTATVTINGIQPTVDGGTTYPTVTLYRIVEPVYDSTDGLGLLKYQAITGVTIADFEKPTQAEIEDIYLNKRYGSNGTAMTVTNGVATATVGAGMYVAVVTGAGTTTYNPMIVSVNYKTDNGATIIEGGEIASGAKLHLENKDLYAKIASPKPQKTITGGTTADDDKPTASVGDVVSYSIKAAVPQYPSNATNKTFYMGDKAGVGLKLVSGSIKINGDAASDKTYWDYAETTDGFNISYDVDDPDIAGVTEVTVTYDMVITDDAVVGSDGNTNKVKLYFAPDPYTGDTYKPVTTPPDNQNGITNTEDTKTVYTYRVAFLKKDGNKDDSNPLADAKFGIYDASGNLVDVVTTNGDGYAASSQVKAGTYTLKELVAPDGFALNPNTYTVTAEQTTATSVTTTTKRTYTSTKPSDDAVSVGWLYDNVFYTTKPNGNAVAAYISGETTLTGEPTTTSGLGGTAVLDLPIPNTPIQELPSTGGSGTYMFILGGALLMALALFAASRKRAASDK